VRVLSLHWSVLWEIIPRPTSAYGFTVPTRRAIIEDTLAWLTCQAERSSTWSHGKI
jgi:hypothetical protein